MNNRQLMGRSALLAAVLGFSIANSFGAAVPVDPMTTITATMDNGTAKTANTWYELGVNTAALTTGLKTGLIYGQTDPLSTYLIQPAKGNNVLLLDSATTKGTLTFDRPLSFTALSLAGSSGNGAGTNILTLHFSDGTSDTLAPLVAGDWFGGSGKVQTASGRIDVTANAFANVNSTDPSVYAINTTLSAADAAKSITSIDFSWTGSKAGTQTAIFGVSGDLGLGHFTAVPLAGTSFNQDVIVGLSEVPEPGTLVLLGLGAAGLVACIRRQRA